jgi:hypothetical protein
VVVWETSSDGVSWNPEYVETAAIPVGALHLFISAGAEQGVAATGDAAFGSVTVEAAR